MRNYLRSTKYDDDLQKEKVQIFSILSINLHFTTLTVYCKYLALKLSVFVRLDKDLLLD